MAIPVAAWLGNAHGEGPKVKDTLRTFRPEARGVTLPVKAQPETEVAEKLPLDWIFRKTVSPVRVVPSVQFPATAATEAGEL